MAESKRETFAAAKRRREKEREGERGNTEGTKRGQERADTEGSKIGKENRNARGKERRRGDRWKEQIRACYFVY